MKKTTKRKPKPYVDTKSPYVVSLNLAGTVIEGKGETILDALRSMKKPVKITTKSVLTVTDGVKSHTRPLTIPLANRLFYPAAQIYHAKNLASVLK